MSADAGTLERLIRFVGDAPATIQSAKVTRPSLTGEGQDPMRRAQLECQRSLWKPGDALITEIRSVDGGWEGTMLVRDWGFTGKCRHRDARAPARITRRSDRELTIAVTRGKTVLQEWRLVR